MQRDTITQYHVDELVEARKVAIRIKTNTLNAPLPGTRLPPTLGKGKPLPVPPVATPERCLKADLRRVDSPTLDLSLEFYPRIMTRELAGVLTPQRPSASLIWRGVRVRGLDYNLVHDVVSNGQIVGTLKGWHEHYWTQADGDASIRKPEPPIHNNDLRAIIAWCCKKWNIEGLGAQGGLQL